MATSKLVRAIGCLVSAWLALCATPQVAPAQDVPADAQLPASGVGDDHRLWIRGEYLRWKIQGDDVPVLVGTIPVQEAELVRQSPGVSITPLFGGPSGIDHGHCSGVRLSVGLWLEEGQRFGLEGSFFQLEQGRLSFREASAGEKALGPVFFDPAAGQAVFIMEAIPGLRSGSMAVEASQRLWGAEVNAIHRLYSGNILDRLDLLVGFRHLQFSEGLFLAGTSRAIPGGRLPCG